MKELTIETLIAVFEEIFGRALFLGLVATAIVATACYIYVLFRDRAVSWRKLLLAQLSMPFGAIGAVLLVQGMTKSHLRDLGGPIDWLVLIAVAGVGAVGAAIFVYTIQSLIKRSAAA